MSEEKRKYVLAQLNSLPNAFQYVEVRGYIELLEQENQQLKEIIDELNENNVYWVNKCANAETMLHEKEQVLDEIREYINKQIREYKYVMNEVQMEDYVEDIYYMIIRNFENALQILDKVKE